MSIYFRMWAESKISRYLIFRTTEKNLRGLETRDFGLGIRDCPYRVPLSLTSRLVLLDESLNNL